MSQCVCNVSVRVVNVGAGDKDKHNDLRKETNNKTASRSMEVFYENYGRYCNKRYDSSILICNGGFMHIRILACIFLNIECKILNLKLKLLYVNPQ